MKLKKISSELFCILLLFLYKIHGHHLTSFSYKVETLQNVIAIVFSTLKCILMESGSKLFPISVRFCFLSNFDF